MMITNDGEDDAIIILLYYSIAVTILYFKNLNETYPYRVARYSFNEQTINFWLDSQTSDLAPF